MEYLTVNELKTLLDNRQVAHPLSRLALLFSCFTGLLPGDLETLQFDHIHHSGSGLIIAKAPSQRNSNIPIRVPLGKMAMGVFAEISDLYNRLPFTKQDGYLFHSLDRETLNSDIRQWVAQSGIPRDIDLTSGRNTFCILSLQAGVSQEELATWCGATLQTISKYLPIAVPAHDADIEAFDALFLPYLDK